MWGQLSPQFEWRASQKRFLEEAGKVKGAKWHLVAPPGSGKTLIGLELARRVGASTLAMAPTTAVRDQWQHSVRLFGADPGTFASEDPGGRTPLLAVTYQLLGNPGEAGAELRAAARRLWLAEVEHHHGPEGAGNRLAALERSDPERAETELHNRVRSLRRSLATGEDIGVPRSRLIGERATALIEELALRGTACIILDECHHLLDWWALVVTCLVERLRTDREVAIIGLTATPPDSETETEAANHRALLGDVDAELQLVAVVAEGQLAPWRDGLRVSCVSGAEQAFLDDWETQLTRTLDGALVMEEFIDWAVAHISDAAADQRAPEDRMVEEHAVRPAALDGISSGAGFLPGPGTVEPSLAFLADRAGSGKLWDVFWDRDPLTARAAARWWQSRGLALPSDFEPPPGTRGMLTLEDRFVLLDAWLYDPKAACAPEVRDRISHLMAPYGISLTTNGVHRSRSVGDIVCSRSTEKGRAAAEILALEAARRGDGLRALVVVERDSATSPPAASRAVLGEDAGTMAQIMAALCTHGAVVDLGLIAVTGRGAWADAVAADRICAAINVASTDTGRWVNVTGCNIRNAVRLHGEGHGWDGAQWLEAAEAALDDGGARVIVATRGLVGEGWDYPPLNVLIDVSEETSKGATMQLRGRAIRLNPDDPAKIASLWDVAVVHPSATGDWQRMRRRQRNWWGPAQDGSVTTGPAKLHPRAMTVLPPGPEELPVINLESATTVFDDEATRAAWAKVDPGGFGAQAVRVRSYRRKVVRTLPPPAKRVRYLRGAWVAIAATFIFVTLAAGANVTVARALFAVGAAAAMVTAIVCIYQGAVPARRHADLTFLALASAVRDGLAAAGRAELRDGAVKVDNDPSGY